MNEASSRPEIRQVYVYIKTLTTMDNLKPGDIFGMESFGDEDCVNEKDLFLVAYDGAPKPQVGRPEGHFEVVGFRLVKDDNFEGIKT